MSDSTQTFIHETAIVEKGVSLGPGSRVWHHCHLRAGARVGANTTLGKNVYIDSGATIGDNCKIQNNVSVYRGVSIEDGVFVGPSAVFTNDLNPRAMTETWQLTPTLVRSGASIGANATIVCGVVIDFWALIGAGSVVTRDVMPHELVGGNPAVRLGWVCECGAVLERTTGRLTQTLCSECGRTLPTNGFDHRHS
jgi:UDP-2-acetamido-3-amino-2,3-dideoxy-glucuronate N-acetyltransferase